MKYDFLENNSVMTFKVDKEDVPMLEIRGNGDFLVKGKLVTNDIEIYHALKEFLRKAKIELRTFFSKKANQDHSICPHCGKNTIINFNEDD